MYHISTLMNPLISFPDKRWFHIIRAWIGIHDTGNDEGTFRCIADEKKIAFKSWHRGEPNNWGKGEDCTEIYFSNWGPKRQWNDIACSHSKPFVCEYPKADSSGSPEGQGDDDEDTEPEEPDDSEEDDAYSCPDGWENRAGKCYKFVARNKNFHDAEKECKRDGGHLACPQTKAENEAIHALAKRR